jgi:spore coat protein U-like protein
MGALAFGSSAGPVTAATATGNFAVSATVQATCAVAASSLAFGAYTGTTLTATTVVSVTCTNTTPYNVALNAGTGTGATVTSRKMTGPGAVLINYGLYRDAAWTLNWGVTAGTDTVAGTGNGSAQALTVYGQMLAAQLVTPGAYSDTITATINY